MYRITVGRKPYRRDYYRCAGHYPERKGCGNMVDLAQTDAAVTALLSMSKAPWKELRPIPGENHDVELAEIKLEMHDLGTRDLPDDEYDAELTRLRTERDRLAALPNIPDHWEEIETGVTVGEHFTSLDFDGKRAMLLENVKVTAESIADPALRQAMVGPLLGLESRLFKMPVEWIGPDAP